MTVNCIIHPTSPLDEKDFSKIIENFFHEGKTIDDRGRNLIKSFYRKDIVINAKSFKIPHLINRIAYKYFRASKAKRSYDHACFLIDHNIGTPKPMAFFEFFNAYGIQQSFYFSEHLDYDLTFRELRSDKDYPDRENIIRQFTGFTFNLHQHGILFKDHSAGNTLIVKNEDQYSFYLIDLNRMDFRTMNLDDRMKNFSKLTEDEDVLKIMSEEYAKLANTSFDLVYSKMCEHVKRFRKKYERRQNLKHKIKKN